MQDQLRRRSRFERHGSPNLASLCAIRSQDVAGRPKAIGKGLIVRYF